jgi:hypothetical protein
MAGVRATTMHPRTPRPLLACYSRAPCLRLEGTPAPYVTPLAACALFLSLLRVCRGFVPSPFTIRSDGRVVERWTRIDEVGLLTQLGLMPAPAGTPA